MTKKKKKDEPSGQQPAEEPATVEAEAAEEAGPKTEGAAAVESRELEEARATAAKNWDLYLRSQADLENYRKRAQKEKEDLSRFANEGILREILPVMDNLERAVEHADAGSEGLLEGVRMTLEQFRRALEKFGVTPVDSRGKPFDPAHHEAMGQVETAEHPPNTVAQELQRGYLLHGRLLRPALVMVSKAPAPGAGKAPSEA